ncbi:MAG: hypothetical protein KF708_06990 [Pirellulales bacterium]|nr:hypothetical protein [Pirellulales bacterium]
MALFADGKHFCKVVWMEGGRVIVRRLYQLTIQQPSGLVYHLTGKDLPDGMIIQTGPTMGGKPQADVLMSQRTGGQRTEDAIRGFPIHRPWPQPRDLMHLGGAVALLGMIRLFVAFASYSQ